MDFQELVSIIESSSDRFNVADIEISHDFEYASNIDMCPLRLYHERAGALRKRAQTMKKGVSKNYFFQ